MKSCSLTGVSNPGPFADLANTTTELLSHTVISPTTFHLKPTQVTHFNMNFSITLYLADSALWLINEKESHSNCLYFFRMCFIFKPRVVVGTGRKLRDMTNQRGKEGRLTRLTWSSPKLAPEVCTITSELKNRFKAGNKRVEGELY